MCPRAPAQDGSLLSAHAAHTCELEEGVGAVVVGYDEHATYAKLAKVSDASGAPTLHAHTHTHTHTHSHIHTHTHTHTIVIITHTRARTHTPAYSYHR